ncbi:EARP and GARP complex-interacting protein 1 [Tribolium castaneum]|uniref:Protein TSSC1-like Protein n=1 Tax=Tribolium castaneum TaxID=7070 RepID=D6WQQ0_TRICA|nr:PREDICTED: protein TSSC1 [Tribolium castaneum]EFA07641.1 Protein TSSC1-like Protein [Tribolium castaneum]|eukprot:XP_975180.1 PREDICTED: protein TSSC1 [Tribolium castaneum]
MENENSVIYGLEFQARALAPQNAEIEKICFLIGTQSLKQATNQIHLVEFNDEDSTLKTSVFNHPEGEIWKLNSSPLDETKLVTCYNSVTNENSCCMKTALYKLPQTENPDTVESLPIVTSFDTSALGNEVKTTEFHPVEAEKVASVLESQVVLWDVSGEKARSILKVQLNGKNNPKFTTGKWNPHQSCNQFTTAVETHLKTYDVRSGELAWGIDNVHSQLLRDLDFNMNKQYHVATCGDDGFIKIWDFRQTGQPVYSRSDHSHWVWCIRFNPFHDQLLLSASSDARVLVSSAASVSSENNNDCMQDETEAKQMISDGPLQWCEHEDSVYCAEWSLAEPWVFASLSYDGRLLISRVKKSLKYQIML